MPPALLFALAAAAAAPPAVVADPPRDAAHPAAMAVLAVPSHGAALNAVLYRPAGAGPHPALVLFHGFPGNEQNLDLAQVARRAGWAVLTLHYRGSWGSPGGFSFRHCAQDADAAVAFLRDPATARRYAIDPARVAVAGHSMGGMMAARAAADDPAVLGAILIDPWDIAATGRDFADPAKRRGFVEGELRGDLPPLAGTGEAALTAEIAAAGPALDLAATVAQVAPRPVAMVFAQRGFGGDAPRLAAATHRPAPVLPTDHSFSDMRIALAAWFADALARLPGAR